MAVDYYNPTGINTWQNPLQTDGQLITATNVVSQGQGIKAKRPGYGTFLNSLGTQINTLFDFGFQNGTQLMLYAAAGGTLSYSAQGTAPWTQATPGTVMPGSFVGNNVFGGISTGVLSIADGNLFWNSTDGINFVTPGTYPLNAQWMAAFHGRLYTSNGPNSNIEYSVTNDPTNWQSVGTSDSSEIVAASPGAVAGLFVAGDTLVINKSRGDMFTWDDTTLTDTSTNLGASSPQSIAQIDTLWFYLNQYGIFSFDGVTRTVLSDAIQNYFFNKQNTGIGSAAIGSAVATTHFWDYIVAVGNVTDDFTQRPINNALIKYDFQKNEFLMWSFNDNPTAIHSFADINNKRQLIFGNASGQVFQLDPTNPSDNGKPIPTEMVFLFNYANSSEAFSQTSASAVTGSSWEKDWRWLRAFFTPGCEINCEYAFSNSLDIQRLKWSETINTKVGQGDYWQFADGALEIRFQANPNNPPRSRFLFVRYYESSPTSIWRFYGQQIDANVISNK